MGIQQNSDSKEGMSRQVEQTSCDVSDADMDGKIDVESVKTRCHGGGWITVPFIFGCEASERLAMAGSHANLITFLVQRMHQKTLTAASILNLFNGVSMLTPLLGASIADAFLGRFSTIALGSWLYLSGMLILTTIGISRGLQPAPCTLMEANAGTCKAASSLQIGIVYLSFVLMALGSGGIRPCVSTFGASQFDQACPKEKKQLKHYFNGYFFTVTAAGLIAATVIVYVQDNVGWGWGFGIPTVVMLLSIAFFCGGSWLYRYSPLRGSPFTRMVQVIVSAVRKRKLKAPADPSKLYTGVLPSKVVISDRDGAQNSEKLPQSKARVGNEEEKLDNPVVPANLNSLTLLTVGPEPDLEDNLRLPSQLRHSDQFRFLDKAAIDSGADNDYDVGQGGLILKARANPWRLCTVQQVEELKCILRMGPMWVTIIPLAIAMSQQSTYTVQQARTMNRHLGKFVVPPASLHTISIITTLVWLPFYDRKVVPQLKKLTGNDRGITFLQKIAVGIMLQLLAMMVTTLVEHKRRTAARLFGLVEKPYATIPFSAFWLVPQFVIGGVADSFSMVGHIEFFYFILPEHMTSTGSALFMTSLAIGSTMSSVVLSTVQGITARHGRPGWLDNNLNKAHLDYFYAFLTVMIFLDFCFYVFVSRWYTNKGTVGAISHRNEKGLNKIIDDELISK